MMSPPSVAKIKVYVRCRPTDETEVSVVDFLSDKRSLIIADKRARDRRYEMDSVFNMKTGQQEVYEKVAKPVVTETVKGYNCTIFAYGQTGTGKTFTIVGERSDPLCYQWADDPQAGIIPRSIADIFKQLSSSGNEFSVRVSFLEIYNETLRDLLYTGVDPPRLQIYECQTNKGTIRVQNLSELAVGTPEQAYELLEKGMRTRQTAATNMNLLSSRSHAVFSIQTTLRRTLMEGKDQLVMGKLHLVDLAGSENIGRSGATDTRAREAGKINASLLTLERVINAILLKGHVPFRESKLTRLLQDSLGGSTKTSIIATISPCRSNVEETLSTLDYALKAKDITNRPIINLKEQSVMLQDYEMEIRKLRDDLAASREKQGVYLSEARYKEILDRVDFLENKCKNMTEDIELKANTIEDLVRDNKTLQKKLRAEELMVQAYTNNESVLHNQANVALQMLISAQNMWLSLKEDLSMCIRRDTNHRRAVRQARDQQLLHLSSICSTLLSKCKDMETMLTSVSEEMNSRQEKHCDFFQSMVNSLQEEFGVIKSAVQEASTCASPLLQRVMETLDLMRSQTCSFLDEHTRASSEYDSREGELMQSLKVHVDQFEQHSHVYQEQIAYYELASEEELNKFLQALELSQQKLSSFYNDVQKEIHTLVKKSVDLTSLNDFVQRHRDIQKRREELQEEEASMIAKFHREQKEHAEACLREWSAISATQDSMMHNSFSDQDMERRNFTAQRKQLQGKVRDTTTQASQYHQSLQENIRIVIQSQEDAKNAFHSCQYSLLSQDTKHRHQSSDSIQQSLEQLQSSLTKNKETGEKIVSEMCNQCCRKMDDVASEVSDNLRHAAGFSSSIAEHCTDTLTECVSNLNEARSQAENLCHVCCEEPPLQEIPELVLRCRNSDDPSSSDYVSAIPLPWSLTKSREEILMSYRTSKRSRLMDSSVDSPMGKSFHDGNSDLADLDEKENEPKTKRGKNTS